jgi:hypothetical protein
MGKKTFRNKKHNTKKNKLKKRITKRRLRKMRKGGGEGTCSGFEDTPECYSVQLSAPEVFQTSNKGQTYRIKKIKKIEEKIEDGSEKYLKLEKILGSQSNKMQFNFGGEEIYYNDTNSERPFVFNGPEYRGYEIFGLNEAAKKKKKAEEAKKEAEEHAKRIEKARQAKENKEMFKNDTLVNSR